MESRFTILSDWKYYLLILAPFFLAAFSIWIFLGEGFIAQKYDLEIIWALIPNFVFDPRLYQAIGIWLLLATMLFVATVIMVARRAPVAPSKEEGRQLFKAVNGYRSWINSGNRIIWLATALIFLLGVGVIYALKAANLLWFEIGVPASLAHAISILLLSISIVAMFLLAVSLRGEELKTPDS